MSSFQSVTHSLSRKYDMQGRKFDLYGMRRTALKKSVCVSFRKMSRET